MIRTHRVRSAQSITSFKYCFLSWLCMQHHLHNVIWFTNPMRHVRSLHTDVNFIIFILTNGVISVSDLNAGCVTEISTTMNYWKEKQNISKERVYITGGLGAWGQKKAASRWKAHQMVECPSFVPLQQQTSRLWKWEQTGSLTSSPVARMHQNNRVKQ